MDLLLRAPHFDYIAADAWSLGGSALRLHSRRPARAYAARRVGPRAGLHLLLRVLSRSRAFDGKGLSPSPPLPWGGHVSLAAARQSASEWKDDDDGPPEATTLRKFTRTSAQRAGKPLVLDPP